MKTAEAIKKVIGDVVPVTLDELKELQVTHPEEYEQMAEVCTLVLNTFEDTNDDRLD